MTIAPQGLRIAPGEPRPFRPPGFAARVIEAPGPADTKNDVSITFLPVAQKPYLEALVPNAGIPAAIAIKARFEANDKEYRFDFPFFSYSQDPSAGRKR